MYKFREYFYTLRFVSRLRAFAEVNEVHAAVPKFAGCNDSAMTPMMVAILIGVLAKCTRNLTPFSYFSGNS